MKIKVKNKMMSVRQVKEMKLKETQTRNRKRKVLAPPSSKPHKKCGSPTAASSVRTSCSEKRSRIDDLSREPCTGYKQRKAKESNGKVQN